MNYGEKQELLFKIYCTYLRDTQDKSSVLEEIKSVGFDKEYLSYDFSNLKFNNLEEDDELIKQISNKINIGKSKSTDKADIKINNVSYSLKCTGHAMPAIINHTPRNGWLKIAERENLDITKLDNIINEYWSLREAEEISEDCGNSNSKSPFKDNIEIIKPFLNYFLFKGTGKGKSNNPADKILSFESYNNLKSWKIYGDEYLDSHWDRLVFSVRSKGMPENYEQHKDKDIIEPWTRNFKGKKGGKKYRGSLHVRVA